MASWRLIPTFKRGVTGLHSDGRGKILLAVSSGWFLSIGVRMIYPVMFPYLRAAFDLGLTQAGLLFTFLFVSYSLGQLPGGILSDRFSERTVLIASILMSGGTVGFLVFANSKALLFFATVLFGISTGLYAVARYTVLYTLYPDRIGTANGIASAAADAGQSLLPPVAGIISAALLWRLGFGFTIPLFLLVAIALWLHVPESDGSEVNNDESMSLAIDRDVFSQLGQPSLLIGTAILLLGISILTSFTAFYPTYLIDEKGITMTTANLLFGSFFAAGVLIKPLSGAAYDRIGARRSLFLIITLAGAGLGFLPFADGLFTIVVVTVLTSMMLGIGTVAETYLIVVLPEDIQGTGFGILRTGYTAVGALSPFLFGVVAERGYFDEAFLVLAVIAGLTVLITLRAPEI